MTQEGYVFYFEQPSILAHRRAGRRMSASIEGELKNADL